MIPSHLEKMDKARKRKLGWISFIPAAAFGSSLVYYLYTLRYMLEGKVREYHEVEKLTSQNYDTYFVLLAISACISAAVLIYFIVLLARFKNIMTGKKILWAVVLVALVPFSFPLFWFRVLNREPDEVPVYDNIG